MPSNPQLTQKRVFQLLLVFILSFSNHASAIENELDPELVTKTKECLDKKNIEACIFAAPRYKKLAMHKEVYMTGKIFCQRTYENCYDIYYSALKYDKTKAAQLLTFLQQSCAKRKGQSCTELRTIYQDRLPTSQYYY